LGFFIGHLVAFVYSFWSCPEWIGYLLVVWFLFCLCVCSAQT